MEYAKMQYPSLNNPYVPPYELPTPSSKNGLIKEEYAGPVEKRKATNLGWLWLFGICVVLWLSTCFYCMAHGDLSRLEAELNPRQNADYSGLKEFARSVKAGAGEIYLSCSSAVVLSVFLIILFRRFAGAIIWFVIGLVLAALGLLTVVSWFAYFYYKRTSGGQKSTSYRSFSSDYDFGDSSSSSSSYNSNKDFDESFIVVPIFATIISLIVAIIIYAIRKHIRMVILLFKEGGKVAESIPFILAQPFVIFAAVVITLFLAVYFALWIDSARKPNGMEKDDLMMFAPYFHIFMVWWIIQFFFGCQHMIIAGATATWYFTRDKARVGNAITTSYKYLLKYHLGSVALGSLIITIIQIIRTIYKYTVKKNYRRVISCLCSVVCEAIEQFVTFLTRIAYVEIAIYGDGLFVSGKRAFRVMTQNVIRLTTINSVGDFVMFLGRCFVTGIAVLIGYLLLQGNKSVSNIKYPLLVIGVVSFAIVHAFMLAFEMIVDSVFICFCEDCDINDGVQRPYYMSDKLMVFMKDDEEPKVLRVGDAATQ